MKNSPSMKKCKKKRKSNSNIKELVRKTLTRYNQIKNAVPKVGKLQPCNSSSLKNAPWQSNYKFKITRAIRRYILAIQRTIINNEVQVQKTNRISINDRFARNDRFTRNTTVLSGENFKLSNTFLEGRIFKMENNIENTTNSIPNVTITFQQMLSIRKKRWNKKHHKSDNEIDVALWKNYENDCIEVVHIDDENHDVIEIKDDGNAVIECIYNNIAESDEAKSTKAIKIVEKKEIDGVVEIEDDLNLVVTENDFEGIEIHVDQQEEMNREEKQENEDVTESKDDFNVIVTENDFENIQFNADQEEEINKELDTTNLIPAIDPDITGENIVREMVNLKENSEDLTVTDLVVIDDTILDTTIPQMPSEEIPKLFIDDISNQSVIIVTPTQNDLTDSESLITISDTSSICQDFNHSDIIFVDEQNPPLVTKKNIKRKSSVVIIEDDDCKPCAKSRTIKHSRKRNRIKTTKKRHDFNVLKQLPSSTITSELASCADVNCNYNPNYHQAVIPQNAQSCASHGVFTWNPYLPTNIAQNNQERYGNRPVNNIFGSNIHNTGYLVRQGLRQIVIDGSNIAIGHSNGTVFSVKGLQIAIDYFIKKGHKVTAFVPQYRLKSGQCTDNSGLRRLIAERLVVLTPSREVKGRRITPYDDRYIIQYATTCEGIVVSNDNYRDLLEEKPEWRYTIEKRLLMYTWVDDILIFPEDPLGRHGPTLSRFLRFP